jgi:hypothetical protein
MSQDLSLSPAVTSACRAITALLTKLEHVIEKSIQYKCSIGQHIAAIKGERPNDWLKVVRTECNLGRQSAYNYLALVNGTKAVEGQRAANAAANKRLRDRQRPSRMDRTHPAPICKRISTRLKIGARSISCSTTN